MGQCERRGTRGLVNSLAVSAVGSFGPPPPRERRVSASFRRSGQPVERVYPGVVVEIEVAHVDRW